MPKVSKNKLDKSAYAFIDGNLVAALSNLADTKQMANLLDSLFTQTERLMLAKRLAIAVLLERGLSYKKISSMLKVSSVTIGSVRNSIMRNNDPYINLVKQIAGRLTIEV